jgi:hypothetical protein
MSNSTDDETWNDPWISLAYILDQPKGMDKPKVTIALLKRIIEAEGVRTYDRWGELIYATDGGEDEPVSKAHVFMLLATFYAELMALEELPPGRHPDRDPYKWLQYDSPLNKFGWPKDEAPDFAAWIAKSLQKSKELSSATKKDNESSVQNSSTPTPETPICKQFVHEEMYDIKRERGCRRLILEYWHEIKSLYEDNADARQVLRVLKRNIEKYERLPALKTVQNRLIDLRKEKLIP